MPSVFLSPSAEIFQAKAETWLSQNEVLNNSFLIALSNLLAKPVWERPEHYFWVVEEKGELVGAAYWTPPYKMTISQMSHESLRALADFIFNSHLRIPGVGGPKESAGTFFDLWNLKTGKSSSLEHSMRIYSLEKVLPVPLSPGNLQIAGKKDSKLLTGWLAKFHEELGLSEELDLKKIVENYIAEQRMFVWEQGNIRAMAGYAGSKSRGARINMVYTPPEFRNQGYASSLVAVLSQNLLDSNKIFCCLYADLLNPTSNNIYLRMGYRPALDWNVYKFE